MQLKDIMTPQVEVIPPGASVQEAAQLMEQLNVGAVPVCDGTRLVGLLTDRDIVVQVVARGLDARKALVREVMTSPIIYAYEDSDVDEAGLTMQANQIRRLLVLNREKRLRGIVSLGDLATRSDAGLAGETLEQISEPSQPHVA